MEQDHSGKAQQIQDVIRRAGGLVIDGAGQPFNYKPAIRALTDRIKAVSQNLGQSQKLVILMAERHEHAADVFLQTSLIKELLPHYQERMACGIEYPHDGLGKLMAACGFNLHPAAYPTVAARDADGQRSLLVSQAVFQREEAPVAHDSLLDFCRRQSIATRFLDAAKTDDSRYLDMQDQLTASIVKQYVSGYAEGCLIPCSSIVGTALRNLAITNNALRHMQEASADTYVISCGIDHVLGNAAEGVAYEHSLTSLFRQTGARVLPILSVNQDSIASLSLQQQEAFPDVLMLTGYDQMAFFAGNASGEADYWRTLGIASGVDLQPFEKGGPEHKALIEKLKNEGPSWLLPAAASTAPRP